MAKGELKTRDLTDVHEKAATDCPHQVSAISAAPNCVRLVFELPFQTGSSHSNFIVNKYCALKLNRKTLENVCTSCDLSMFAT